jgi:hypothetical protein
MQKAGGMPENILKLNSDYFADKQRIAAKPRKPAFLMNNKGQGGV